MTRLNELQVKINSGIAMQSEVIEFETLNYLQIESVNKVSDYAQAIAKYLETGDLTMAKYHVELLQTRCESMLIMLEELTQK